MTQYLLINKTELEKRIKEITETLKRTIYFNRSLNLCLETKLDVLNEMLNDGVLLTPELTIVFENTLSSPEEIKIETDIKQLKLEL